MAFFAGCGMIVPTSIQPCKGGDMVCARGPLGAFLIAVYDICVKLVLLGFSQPLLVDSLLHQFSGHEVHCTSISDQARFMYPCRPLIARRTRSLLRFLAAHSHTIVKPHQLIPVRMYFSASAATLDKMNGYLSHEISVVDLVARADGQDRNGYGPTMEDCSDSLGLLGQGLWVSTGPLPRVALLCRGPASQGTMGGRGSR